MRLQLKMKILEMYHDQVSFAKECGRNENWLSRVVTGRQAPNEREKEMMARLLQIKNVDDYLSDFPEGF